MIVRKIRREDYKRACQLCALAFDYPMENGHLSSEELLSKTMEQPESMQDLHWDSQWAAFADDDKTMLSTFSAIPYRANFDGHEVGMMGIGGVASLPEYRRMGGVRACFEKALPDMYDQGYAFSYLYPFSTVFYRKFGYELGCERVLHKLKLSDMSAFDIKGSYHLVEKGVDLKQDVRDVYRTWTSRYNLMTIDEEIDESWMDRLDPFHDKSYTYIYRNEQGVPKGYLTYSLLMENNERCLDCSRRFVFADPEGFRGLMNLIMRLKADYSYALINLPPDVDLGALLPEWSFGYIERTRSLYGMVRVIDAVQVLQKARMRGTGELIIELSDEQIVQNNGRFHVRFANGKTTTVERTEEAADISMPIHEFSRLICGRNDAADFAWLPQVHLHCSAEKAAQVFYRKPMYIIRYF